MWVAVNENGVEVCSNNKMWRYEETLDKFISRAKVTDEKYSEGLKMYKNRYDDGDFWCNCSTDGYYSIPDFEGVFLPEGTIEKLTGKKMTWSDEPVEIKSL